MGRLGCSAVVGWPHTDAWSVSGQKRTPVELLLKAGAAHPHGQENKGLKGRVSARSQGHPSSLHEERACARCPFTEAITAAGSSTVTVLVLPSASGLSHALCRAFSFFLTTHC